MFSHHTNELMSSNDLSTAFQNASSSGPSLCKRIQLLISLNFYFSCCLCECKQKKNNNISKIKPANVTSSQSWALTTKPEVNLNVSLLFCSLFLLLNLQTVLIFVRRCTFQIRGLHIARLFVTKFFIFSQRVNKARIFSRRQPFADSSSYNKSAMLSWQKFCNFAATMPMFCIFWMKNITTFPNTIMCLLLLLVVVC